MVTQETTNGNVEEGSTDFFLLRVVLSRKDENMITHNYRLTHIHFA